MDKWDLVYESPSLVLKDKLGWKSTNSENEMKMSSLKCHSGILDSILLAKTQICFREIGNSSCVNSCIA